METNKPTSFIGSKKFMLLVSLIGIFFISTGSSWAIFSFLKGEPAGLVTTSDGKRKIDPTLPKTEECPINGKKFSKPEREIWESRRPIAAIIENHLDSRPQSGISKADVVYEAVAEGGITRFLNVFYCGASAEDVRIAPIRSVRVYFVDWASEYSEYPIFVHSGGANNICNNCPGGVKSSGQVAREVDAFKLLENLGWRATKSNAMDAGTNIGAPIVIRNQFRLGTKAAWEHSFEGFTDKLYEEAEKRGFVYEDSEGNAWNEDFVSWKFADDSPSGSPNASEISFEFWSNKPDYDVSWKYEPSGNRYLRSNGAKEHMDYDAKEQLSAKNVVIQFVKEKGPVDKEGHMFYTTTGEGKALIFQNGVLIEGTWEKEDRSSRTRFYDENSKEIIFVRGNIWIEEVPAGNEIKY